MYNLVIVESPPKANTIKSYLGSNYKVIACKGHIRDLPKSTLGIDVDNGFAPHYINIRGKGDIIKELKKEAKGASKVFLATDPDREGEAIAWHIADQLGIPKENACRITFNEITKSAVKEAIKKPRAINVDLVNSQQARRILDRLVGFKLSQLLWKSLKGGLSGGRVQSVATRMISEREQEIRDFVPQEYWTVTALLGDENSEVIPARFYGNKSGKLRIENETEASTIVDKISGKSFSVKSVKHAEKQKLPAPPFTTSSLLQEASRKLGFQSQKTMKVAQELYDGLNLGAELGGVQGLITYMRTDSIRVSEVAQSAAREYIKENFGSESLPKATRAYKVGAGAQDAHEAIRPSNVYFSPKALRKMLSLDQYKLYRLIWERFVASQMEVAVFDTVAVELECSGYIFKTGGYTVKSRGYMVLNDTAPDADKYTADEDDIQLTTLPNLKKGENIVLKDVKKEQHFTEPPAHYTEASLIDFFKENGIGRPSTYVPTILIIISREYVKRDGKSLVATPLGEMITEFMSKYFPEIIDYEFTASMEEKLDSIENKENTIEGVLSEFYEKFKEELDYASEKADEEKISIPVEESDVICDKCGAKMVYKNGRYGKFLACPSYPACKNTKAIDKNGAVAESADKTPELAGFKCEHCGGEMVVRNGRYGTFYACANYPTCTFTKQKITETGVDCPKCASKIIARHGKGRMLFYSCERYPECDFSTWDMPLREKCPVCSAGLYYRKSRKTVMCKNKGCEYKREEEMAVIE